MNPVPEAAGLVVFSDLDGTLLRHEDYDWSEARPALAELARRRIPLVLTSSKTRAEIEAWRSRLGIADPFISENGGALFVPPEAAPRAIPGARPVEGYRCVQLGESYPRLRSALASLSGSLGVPLRGFGDMSPADIERLTGLSGEDAMRCKAREFDEPFVPERPLSEDEEARLEAGAEALGLRLTRGGRFHHLTGASDKGRAARLLVTGYRSADPRTRSMGLGDGPNDLELLRAVDHPVVVARPDGTHAPELVRGLPSARFTTEIGPAGFNAAVLSYLEPR